MVVFSTALYIGLTWGMSMNGPGGRGSNSDSGWARQLTAVVMTAGGGRAVVNVGGLESCGVGVGQAAAGVTAMGGLGGQRQGWQARRGQKVGQAVVTEMGQAR
jgi:hypothetical protein